MSDRLAQIERNYLQDTRQQPYQSTHRLLAKDLRNEITPKGKFQGDSTYVDHYPEKKAQDKRLLIKPEAQLKIGGQFSGGSSYSKQYFDKGVQSRTQKYPLPVNQVMPDGKFIDSSTYHNAYLASVPKKTLPFKPQGQLKVGEGSFQGNSSYSYDYLGEAAQRNQRVPLPHNEVMPKGIFQGSSTYGKAYVNSPAKREKPFVPEQQLKVGGRFEGQTSYNKDYDEKESPKRREKIVGVDNQIMPQGRFEGNSVYQSNYLQSKQERVQPIRPEQQLKIGGRFQGNSTYGDNYIQNGMYNRVEKIVHPDNQIMPEGRFNDSSTYNGAYVENSWQRNLPFKPEGQLKVGEGNFEGKSSYNADYQNRIGEYARREKIVQGGNHIMPEGRFNDSSTYNGAFVSNPLQSNPQIKPEGQLKVGEGNFEGKSSYNADYQNRIGEYARREKIVQGGNHIMPEGRFNDLSTYNGAFVANPLQPNPQIKPEGQLKVGEGNFEGRSRYNADYENRSGEYARREKIVQGGNHIMPEGRFNDYSTYNGAYVSNPLQSNPQIKPEGQLKVGEGNFEGQSRYNADYQNRSGEYARREKIVQGANEVLPGGKFVGNSTYEQHFVENKMVRNPPMIPKQQLRTGENCFEGISTYNDNYRNGRVATESFRK